MGEQETRTEATENGTTSLSEKPAEAVTEEKEVKEDDGVKEMEEDKKVDEQVEKMDEDSEAKEEKETKEEKEAENVKDAMEEEENEENEEKEEVKTEAVEEENGTNEKGVTDEQERSKEDVKEKFSEDEERKAEETKKLKGSAKHVKDKSVGEKGRQKKSKIEGKKEPEQRTPPVVDRPVRERKSVERLVASIEKDSSRELHIEKGRGTPLKDIPNVAFKLSRRKTDDTFRLLHSILFGRRGKAFQVKSNISRFSGFVWHGNEEKQKIKVKEKFDKCNKEKLLEFCDVLDIPISKTTRRKEDIVVSLIDFLVAPHATTTVLLAEKESNKSKKRKRVAKQSPSAADSTPSKRSTKSQRKTENTSRMEKSTGDTDDESSEEEEEIEEEEKENGVPEKSEDKIPEQSESEDKNESEDESEEDVGKHKQNAKASRTKESGGKAGTKKITVSTKSSPPPKRTPKKAPSNCSKVDEDSDTRPKVFSRKKKNEKVTKEKTSTPTKSTSKEKSGKKVAKGKEKAKAEKSRTTDEELRDAICEILKEVDFNTATFTDILKQLAQQFDTDLTSRKSSIKLMIQEELTKLADEAEDEDGEGDAEKDETHARSHEVEA